MNGRMRGSCLGAAVAQKARQTFMRLSNLERGGRVGTQT